MLSCFFSYGEMEIYEKDITDSCIDSIMLPCVFVAF